MSAATVVAETNVRPQLAIGASGLYEWNLVDHGYVFGFTIEVEHNARWSSIAELELHWLTGARPRTLAQPWHYRPPKPEETPLGIQFGLRVHLIEATRVRPYLQAGVGVRAISEEYSTSSRDDEETISSGMTAHMRLGLTLAGYRGAGLFLDAGVESVLHNPGDYLIAPLRVGLTLP